MICQYCGAKLFEVLCTPKEVLYDQNRSHNAGL